MDIHYTGKDRILLIINYILLGFFVLAILLPLVYVVLSSFLTPNTLITKGFAITSSDWTLTGYAKILSNSAMIRGFFNAIFYSAAFAFATVLFSVFAAYPLAIEELVGKRSIMIFFLITMFFGGGLIPTYLVIKDLGMLNTVWAIILPGSISVFNIILAKTYFQGLPKELFQAASIDGASELSIFFKIVLPLSKPIIFVLALYAFVGQWNSYFDAMIYLDDPKLFPLQLVLRSILIQNQVQPGMIADAMAQAELKKLSEMIKYSAIVISSLPLIVMYPFFQKYFEKGVMVGSIK
ncbi:MULTISPECIES: carbohydrate ABC transporter permease [Paenibacillus]|jgi:putative aldouronate transport system permease protein|uniref:Sugar ABC transporter permease n=2 Tax=Paenibacillus TaxID=44249 RepID=A0ABX2ZKY5_PAEPO|nr:MULTISPECIES: carbohydrate ABC transporter permease [Paenibacillus]APQ59524.1 sugar ABC transporter permease [Paenibacillus polymyxa]MDR6775879.1 putative aldouronate transport system permease protein [Paenibacillus peoriae]ODA11171.1 sugar ABC transporter permease [Paenibacillus polymyxa]ODB63080.1 sugar ABC transporter permease [Paenibacillus polymyxa]OME66452.1 sugar ABC transporter permease [Paenibacillus peoriae]